MTTDLDTPPDRAGGREALYATIRSQVWDQAGITLGAALYSPALRATVEEIIGGYIEGLKRFGRAIESGSHDRARTAFWTLANRPSSKLATFLMGNLCKLDPMTFAQLEARAGRVNPYKPSGERVRVTMHGKEAGGARPICAFGPLTRAAQEMVKHAVIVGLGHSPFEYARRGRGREAAADTVLHSIRHRGVRWFVVADVKDFFPFVTREHVKEACPFLPWSVIASTVFIHDDTAIRFRDPYGIDDINSSAQAVRAGMPQGSLASPVIASKVLQPCLQQVSKRLAVVHVDNVIVGGSDQDEAQSMFNALISSLEGNPCGPLRLIGDVMELGDRRMDFLGYRFRQRSKEWGGFGRACPSYKAMAKQRVRMSQQAVVSPGEAFRFAEEDSARWVRSHSRWETRERCEDFAFLAACDVIATTRVAAKRLKIGKMRWRSFREMRDDVVDIARAVSNAVGDLTSKGPATTHHLWLVSGIGTALI